MCIRDSRNGLRLSLLIAFLLLVGLRGVLLRVALLLALVALYALKRILARYGKGLGLSLIHIFRADLGIVGRDQLTAGQRRAVGDRNAEQHLLEIGIVPVGIGFQRCV